LFGVQPALSQDLLSDAEVQSEIQMAINATPLPSQIDQLTTLTSMQIFGVRGLQYNYTLGLNRSDLGGDAQINTALNTIRNSAKDTLCNNPAMIWYKSNFVELRYVYYDKSSEHVFDFRLTPNDC